jgi:hypothetical protein
MLGFGKSRLIFDAPGLALNADPTSIRHPGDAPDNNFLCPEPDMPFK